MTNPLLTLVGPPDFRAIDPADVMPAITFLVERAEAAMILAAGVEVAAEYHQLSAALDVRIKRLGMAWNVVSHLHAVADTPALRKSYFACLPKVTAFYTSLRGNVACIVNISPRSATRRCRHRRRGPLHFSCSPPNCPARS